MLIVADDLTGAADTAGAFATAGHQCVVVLDRSTPVFLPNSTVVALDELSCAVVPALLTTCGEPESLPLLFAHPAVPVKFAVIT